jgi:chromosome segregation ATPase
VSEDFTKELPGATPFEKRVLAELAALRGEVSVVRGEVSGVGDEVSTLRTEVGVLRTEVGMLRGEVAEVRLQQAAMAKNIAALDQCMTSLEEKVDSRLKETRPIWEAVREQIEKLDEKFSLFIHDLYDIRTKISRQGKRLDDLEQRVVT